MSRYDELLTDDPAPDILEEARDYATISYFLAGAVAGAAGLWTAAMLTILVVAVT